MWNMPSAIVEAAALHHEPALDCEPELTPLAAVHIANVLERELGPSDEDMMVAPIINTPFLNHVGLLQRLPLWRAAFANRRSGNVETYVQSAETNQSQSNALQSSPSSRSANYLPGPAPSTQTGTAGQSANPDRTHANTNRSWVYATVGLGVLLLLALWLKTEPDLNNTEPAYARTPARLQTPADVSSAPPRQRSLAASPDASAEAPVQAAPTPTAAATTDLKPAVSVAAPDRKPLVSPSAPESTASTSHNPMATNVPPLAIAQEKPVPEFRLNAIFYTAVRPTAILNGETVTVGDELNGATVVAITRTTVTLLVNGQRKTYGLR
jgi:hypothetical protein